MLCGSFAFVKYSQPWPSTHITLVVQEKRIAIVKGVVQPDLRCEAIHEQPLNTVHKCPHLHTFASTQRLHMSLVTTGAG